MFEKHSEAKTFHALDEYHCLANQFRHLRVHHSVPFFHLKTNIPLKIYKYVL